jgi:hypothetical protein
MKDGNLSKSTEKQPHFAGKAACFTTIFILLSWLLQSAPQAPEPEGNGKRMGFASFLLKAGNSIGLGIGVEKVDGEIYDINKSQEEMPYLDFLRMELIKISEIVLTNNAVFEYVPVEKLKYEKSDEDAALEYFFQKNDLYGALSVKASLGVCFGLQKKVNMTTIWEITNSSGYKVKIKTYSKSKKTHGMFPDTEDPELEPVFLDLAKENAEQFLEQLASLLQEDEKLQ